MTIGGSDTAENGAVQGTSGIRFVDLRGTYLGRLMDYAVAVSWGKKRMTREAAHNRRAELAAT